MTIESDREKARLLPNALLAAVQVIVAGAVMFFLYRFLLQRLGVESIGLWSIVLATASIARIFEFGLSNSAMRYVSKHLALGDDARAAAALQTATMSVALLLAGAALAGLPAVSWALSFILDEAALTAGRRLLPFVMASVWLSGVAASVQAGLIGCHRSDLFAIVTIAASFVFLLSAIYLVPDHGLEGLAVAQMAQGGVVIAIGWAMLRKNLAALPRVKLHWSRPAFNEMWRYSVNFQLMDILRMLTEPVTKALLTYFGSLAAAGYYEMANRMVQKCRELILSSNRVMLPYFSKLNETDNSHIGGLYLKSLNLVILIASTVLFVVAAAAAGISQAWIGSYQEFFVVTTWILVAGWLVNGLASPAYIAILGTDDVAINTVGHFILLVVNIVASTIFGWLWGEFGVVLGWAAALASMGIYVLVAFHRREGIKFGGLLTTSNVLIVGLSLVGIVVANIGYAYWGAGKATLVVLLAQAGVFMAIVSPAFYLHEMGRSLVASLFALGRKYRA